MFSTKSRHYLDLFIQRVKESFTSKESAEATGDTTRKSEMKNIQESIKQVHGNIYIFSRSIEQLSAENETSLGRSLISVEYPIDSFDLVDALQRHLIRSLCADMCDMIIREIDASAGARTTAQMSIEVRLFLIDQMYLFIV